MNDLPNSLTPAERAYWCSIVRESDGRRREGARAFEAVMRNGLKRDLKHNLQRPATVQR